MQRKCSSLRFGDENRNSLSLSNLSHENVFFHLFLSHPGQVFSFFLFRCKIIFPHYATDLAKLKKNKAPKRKKGKKNATVLFDRFVAMREPISYHKNAQERTVVEKYGQPDSRSGELLFALMSTRAHTYTQTCTYPDTRTTLIYIQRRKTQNNVFTWLVGFGKRRLIRFCDSYERVLINLILLYSGRDSEDIDNSVLFRTHFANDFSANFAIYTYDRISDTRAGNIPIFAYSNRLMEIAALKQKNMFETKNISCLCKI